MIWLAVAAGLGALPANAKKGGRADSRNTMQWARAQVLGRRVGLLGAEGKGDVLVRWGSPLDQAPVAKRLAQLAEQDLPPATKAKAAVAALCLGTPREAAQRATRLLEKKIGSFDQNSC